LNKLFNIQTIISYSGLKQKNDYYEFSNCIRSKKYVLQPNKSHNSIPIMHWLDIKPVAKMP